MAHNPQRSQFCLYSVGPPFPILPYSDSQHHLQSVLKSRNRVEAEVGECIISMAAVFRVFRGRTLHNACVHGLEGLEDVLIDSSSSMR
jgi:hypothetical protein